MSSGPGDMGMLKLNGKGFDVEPNWSGKMNGINAGYLAHGMFQNCYHTTPFLNTGLSTGIF